MCEYYIPFILAKRASHNVQRLYAHPLRAIFILYTFSTFKKMKQKTQNNKKKMGERKRYKNEEWGKIRWREFSVNIIYTHFIFMIWQSYLRVQNKLHVCIFHNLRDICLFFLSFFFFLYSPVCCMCAGVRSLSKQKISVFMCTFSGWVCTIKCCIWPYIPTYNMASAPVKASTSTEEPWDLNMVMV